MIARYAPRAGQAISISSIVLSLFILVHLAGCVTPAVPQTTTQQIALTRVSLAALYNTATSLSQANRLTIEQLKGIHKTGGQAEDALSAAEIALSINKNEAAAIESLRVAQRLLRELDSTVKEASK